MKLGNYVIMIVIMLVFLEFIGINTTLSTTLSVFNINIDHTTGVFGSASLGGGGFWTKLIAVLSVVSLGGAIVIGVFAKSYDPSLVILPLILFVATSLIGSFWAIMQLFSGNPNDWAIKLIATIFIAVGLGFIWSCVDYFAGR